MSGRRPGTPRIVLARTDHLGDVLLTLPAATALRRALPGAEISVLAPEGVVEVARRCPDVDATHAVPAPVLTVPFEASGWRRVAEREGVALRGRFDLALLPRPDDPWTGPLVAAAGIPVRLGYDMPRTRPYLTAALPVPGGCHVVTFALQLAAMAARCLGTPATINTLAPPVRLVPTADDEAEATEVLASVTDAGDPPVVLHPGSGWPLKNWPPDRWGELAAALRQWYGVAPLVTGSAAEEDLVRVIVAASGGAALGLAGRLSLGGLIALLRRARLLIATDGGPLHLAAAVGTPVVGLYGPADPVMYRPWCPPERRRIVRVQLPCSPCGTLLDPPCGAATEPACVTGITLDAVLTAANEMIAARPGQMEGRTRCYVPEPDGAERIDGRSS